MEVLFFGIRNVRSRPSYIAFIFVFQCLSEFACEVEFNVFEVLLCHAQYISGVGKEHIAPLTVFCHILIFAFLE